MSLFRRVKNKIFPQRKIVQISIPALERCFEAESGQTVLQILKKEDIDIDHFCGGGASCGTCLIRPEESNALSSVRGREKIVLGYSRSQSGERLACQAIVEENITLHIL